MFGNILSFWTSLFFSVVCNWSTVGQNDRVLRHGPQRQCMYMYISFQQLLKVRHIPFFCFSAQYTMTSPTHEGSVIEELAYGHRRQLLC